MNIRKFDEKDYPAIFDIYAQSKLNELQFEDKEFELLPLENDYKRFTKLKESDIFVYEDSNVVGYGAVYDSEIRALFVHPGRRGEGIGKTLLHFLLSKTSGTVNLYVAKTNAPAKNLYKKFGFTVVDEFETTYNGKPVFANQMKRTVLSG